MVFYSTHTIFMLMFSGIFYVLENFPMNCCCLILDTMACVDCVAKKEVLLISASWSFLDSSALKAALKSKLLAVVINSETFRYIHLVPAYLGSPRKRAIKCVYVLDTYTYMYIFLYLQALWECCWPCLVFPILSLKLFASLISYLTLSLLLVSMLWCF